MSLKADMSLLLPRCMPLSVCKVFITAGRSAGSRTMWPVGKHSLSPHRVRDLKMSGFSHAGRFPCWKSSVREAIGSLERASALVCSLPGL